MTSEQQHAAPQPDLAGEETIPAGHPASEDDFVSAGEALSGRGPQPDGVLGERTSSDGDREPLPTVRSEPGGHATSADRRLGASADEADDGYGAADVVEDAIDYFGGDQQTASPASESDAPAPG